MTLSPELHLVWRPMADDDRSYVIKSWLMSHYDSPEWAATVQTPHGPSLQHHVGFATYSALYQPAIKRMLERGQVAICFDEELPGSILGFLATEGDLLHYIHVRGRFRRMGVATWMLNDFRNLDAVYTHQPSRTAQRLCGPTWRLDDLRRFDRKQAA